MRVLPNKLLKSFALLIFAWLFTIAGLYAQDSAVTVKKSYVKNTFDGNYLIDNQSVIVPIRHTMEFDIQHRFGTVNNGIHDFFGFFNVSNVRLAVSYTICSNFQLGLGLVGDRMQTDLNAKWALLKQTKDGIMPVSVTYFGNIAVDPRGHKYDSTATFVTTSDHFSFFNQIIIARKFNDRLSLQVAPSWSHFNSIVGPDGNIATGTKYEHFAVAFSGRYKISPTTGINVNYDLPLSNFGSPKPNLSFGFEFKTSGHDFQLFVGNYGYVLPQNNNFYNQNDFTKGQFLIGFNITRLWNF